MDLTGCNDCEEQKENDSKGTKKEPFIALEDTMSAFVESFLSTKSLSNTVNNQENSDTFLDGFID